MQTNSFKQMTQALEENITRNSILDESCIAGNLDAYQADKGMRACMANLEYIEAQMLALRPETPEDVAVLLVAVMSQMQMMKEIAIHDHKEAEMQLQVLRRALQSAIQSLLCEEFRDSETWNIIRTYYIGSNASGNVIQTH